MAIEPIESLPEAVNLLIRFDSLKEVERQNPILSGKRRETVGEHSWHVGLGVFMLRDYAQGTIDMSRALELAVLHELPELFVGDTFVYGPRDATRSLREAEAVRLFEEQHLGQLQTKVAIERWREYELRTSDSAKYVYAVDLFMPILLNYFGGQTSSWVHHRVPLMKVRSRVDELRKYSPGLAIIADQLVDSAEVAGHFSHEDGES